MPNQRLKVIVVAGARPNFMKVAPLMRAFEARPNLFSVQLLHTGQHYDAAMSDTFFDELGIREPEIRLEVGSGSHAQQTARIMQAFEQTCLDETPALVIVVGDVNSTMACALVAKKLQIDVAHVEAGLRSGDRTMPEEVNRLVTDAISDWLFVTEPAGVENLLREGHPPSRIRHVGHVMIDNLLYQKRALESGRTLNVRDPLLAQLDGLYGVVTLHRPSNVDDENVLGRILGALGRVAGKVPLVFAVHPRTRAMLDQYGLQAPDNMILIPPQPYMTFLQLWSNARFVITDSGGLQEETTALGVPCITVRENTERPITLTEGTNVLVGTDPERLVQESLKTLIAGTRSARRPALWDGRAAERIVHALAEAYLHGGR